MTPQDLEAISSWLPPPGGAMGENPEPQRQGMATQPRKVVVENILTGVNRRGGGPPTFWGNSGLQRGALVNL
jgi:hypothetical protein